MPIDGAGFFTRLFKFTQDRDDGIRILASRVDAEFDNVAEALNTPVTTEKLTYNGESLAALFDRILQKLAVRVVAEDVGYGTSNVSAELQKLRSSIDTNDSEIDARMTAQEQRKYAASEISYDGTQTVAQAIADIRDELDTPPISEGYWSNGVQRAPEGTWSPTGAVVSEGVWQQ